jgi:hypothetical protein
MKSPSSTFLRCNLSSRCTQHGGLSKTKERKLVIIPGIGFYERLYKFKGLKPSTSANSRACTNGRTLARIGNTSSVHRRCRSKIDYPKPQEHPKRLREIGKHIKKRIVFYTLQGLHFSKLVGRKHIGIGEEQLQFRRRFHETVLLELVEELERRKEVVLLQ